jgi:hypothetical protein
MALCNHGNEQNIDIRSLLDEFMTIFTGYLDRFCHITGGYNRLEKLFKASLI